jgi:hypothetical protein
VRHQIPAPPQHRTQLLLLPPQPLIQQQLRVREHARVEQRGAVATEEPGVAAEQHGQRLEGLVGLAVQVVGVDDGAVLEQLGGCGSAEGARHGGAHERVAGCRRDVEGVRDGGEVARGEVEVVELGLGQRGSGTVGYEGRAYPGIPDAVIEEGLVCFVADVGRLLDLGSVVGCVFVDLGGGDRGEGFFRGDG